VKKVTISFEVDVPGLEDFDFDVARILAQAERKLSVLVRREPSLCTAPEDADVLRDVNGNVIGKIELQ
jgi:hypothetical protein